MAYEDAQKQIGDINGRIEMKTSSLKDIQNDIEKLKLEASEARKVEQVSISNICICHLFLHFQYKILGLGIMQACLEEQERLMPLEQAARQKVVELSSIMESEKNQGSVLKAILHAKEANIVPGIYGRMGDLGAIDGEHRLFSTGPFTDNYCFPTTFHLSCKLL